MKDKAKLRPLSETRLVGRTQEQRRLSRALRNGVFPQNLLITGDRGVGKRRLALYVAQLLLCADPDENGPCGQCQDCHLARSLSHPDLHVYVPHKSISDANVEHQIEKIDEEIASELDKWRNNALHVLPETTGAYYVGTIRSIARKVYQKAYRNGGRKILILTAAERLAAFGHSTEAANALLKILEEPPENTHFIFTSALPHQLLDTIRSRMTELRLPPLSKEEITEILQNAGASFSVDQCTGSSVTEALEWLGEDWQSQLDTAIQLLGLAFLQDHLSRYNTTRQFGSKGARGDFASLLELMEFVAYECATLASLGIEEHRTHPGIVAFYKEHANTPDAVWVDIVKVIQRALEAAKANGNPQLILHRLLHEVAHVIR